VEAASLLALHEAAARLREAEARVRAAAEDLLELGADLAVDATRRLRERGASEAQVARYERSIRERSTAVQDALRALDEAATESERAIAEVS
jgi:cob(I)alamin adenosyltransferase